MAPNDLPLSGVNILLIEQDGFLSDYLSSSLVEAGAGVMGPARSAADANDLLAGLSTVPDAAVIDAQLYEANEFLGRHIIGAAGIPVLLVSRGGYVPVFASADTLVAPFAAYQVVDHITRAVRQGSRSSVPAGH